jgi:hypothetical protein
LFGHVVARTARGVKDGVHYIAFCVFGTTTPTGGQGTSKYSGTVSVEVPWGVFEEQGYRDGSQLAGIWWIEPGIHT